MCVYVIAKPLITNSITELHEDDRAVPGVYRVLYDNDVPKEDHGRAALDIFHARMGVKVLEDFEFSVVDAAGTYLEGENENPDDDSEYCDRGDLDEVSLLEVPFELDDPCWKIVQG